MKLEIEFRFGSGWAISCSGQVQIEPKMAKFRYASGSRRTWNPNSGSGQKSVSEQPERKQVNPNPFQTLAQAHRKIYLYK